MLLHIEERELESGIILVQLTGKLALGIENQRIEMLMEGIAKRGQMRAILDLTGVEYIDSASVGLLMLSSSRMKEIGGKLVVVAPEGRVHRFLKVTQIDTILTVRDSIEQAVSALRETFPPAAA
jgi:anti-sigma B factor antagonist